VAACTALSFAVGHMLHLRLDKPLAAAARGLVMKGRSDKHA
jgi:hypothetical protein